MRGGHRFCEKDTHKNTRAGAGRAPGVPDADRHIGKPTYVLSIFCQARRARSRPADGKPPASSAGQAFSIMLYWSATLYQWPLPSFMSREVALVSQSTHTRTSPNALISQTSRSRGFPCISSARRRKSLVLSSAFHTMPELQTFSSGSQNRNVAGRPACWLRERASASCSSSSQPGRAAPGAAMVLMNDANASAAGGGFAAGASAATPPIACVRAVALAGEAAHAPSRSALVASISANRPERASIPNPRRFALGAERLADVVSLGRKAVHLQQHAHEDHRQPEQHWHGTFPQPCTVHLAGKNLTPL